PQPNFGVQRSYYAGRSIAVFDLMLLSAYSRSLESLHQKGGWRNIMLRLLRTYIALAFVAALFAINPCHAGDVNYPTQTVRLISTFEAGGGNDFMARVLAQKFTEDWNKTVIVEDKPGGAGDIGTNYVAHATPDGYTLLVTTNATIVINPQLFK